MSGDRILTPEIESIKKAYLEGRKVPDVDIALASHSVIDEYRWLPYPTPPQQVAKYYALPVEQKVKMNRTPDTFRSFWSDPEVVKFFDTRNRIKNKNVANEDWLKWMLKVLEEPHPEKVTAINIKLHQFTDQGSSSVIDQPNWNE